MFAFLKELEFILISSFKPLDHLSWRFIKVLLLVLIELKDAFLLPLVPVSIMYSTKGNCGRILSYTEIQLLPFFSICCTIKSHISISAEQKTYTNATKC